MQMSVIARDARAYGFARTIGWPSWLLLLTATSCGMRQKTSYSRTRSTSSGRRLLAEVEWLMISLTLSSETAGGAEHLQRQGRVLDAGNIHAGDQQDDVRRFEGGRHQLVEGAGGVDDHVVVRLREQVDDLGDVLAADGAPLRRVEGRRQDLDAAAVADQVFARSPRGRCCRCCGRRRRC